MCSLNEMLDANLVYFFTVTYYCIIHIKPFHRTHSTRGKLGISGNKVKQTSDYYIKPQIKIPFRLDIEIKNTVLSVLLSYFKVVINGQHNVTTAFCTIHC